MPSQQSYRTGQWLQVELAPPAEGVTRYLALQLPDDSLFALTAPNTPVPFDVAALANMPPWQSQAALAVDLPVSEEIPPGEYGVYQVDVPAGQRLSVEAINGQTLRGSVFQVQ